MTHDELLAKVDNTHNLPQDLPHDMQIEVWIQRDKNIKSALRAVVELHKPNKNNLCEICRYYMNKHKYPCPTIQAIEKELS